MQTYRRDCGPQPGFISQVQSPYGSVPSPQHASATAQISTNPTLNAVLPLRPPSPGVVERSNTLQMDLDSANGNGGRTKRDTSVLSMDDIEAAQALEGLRSGTAYIWYRDDLDVGLIQMFDFKIIFIPPRLRIALFLLHHRLLSPPSHNSQNHCYRYSHPLIPCCLRLSMVQYLHMRPPSRTHRDSDTGQSL
jgi:hypothetical protein